MQTSQSTSEPKYLYAELEGSAREKARNHYIEHWIHDDWYDYIFEDAKEVGAANGFEIEDLAFSGFWSQGDGAMWVGTVNLPDFIKHHLPESIGRDCWLWLMEDGCMHDRVNIIRTNHRYAHENCMGIESFTVYDHDPDDTLRIDCILKGAPIDTVWNLLMADKACPVRSVDDLEELVLDEARNFAKNLYKTLESGYEHECSDYNISEHYNANDIYFNEEGVIL